MIEYGANRSIPQLGCIGIGFAPYSLTVAQYGAVGRAGSNAPDQPVGTAPVKITGFNGVFPNRLLVDGQTAPEGIGIADDGQGVVVTAPGLYSLYANIPTTLAIGRTYVAELFVDGVSVGLESVVDLSNQSNHADFNIGGVRALDVGQEITLTVRADQAAQQFIMLESSEFGLFRVR